MIDHIYNQLIPILIVGGYLMLLILIAEFLSRVYDTDSELTRKIVHIGTGNVILLASVGASCVAIASYLLPILPSVNGVGRKSLGTLFYAISIGILAGLFWGEETRQFTAIGILIMSYGDGTAALVGQNFGKHPYQAWGNKKSWEGSLAMTIVGFIITLLILSMTGDWQWSYVLIALLAGIFATILETFSQVGIDNLTVPVGSGLIVYYLLQFVTFS